MSIQLTLSMALVLASGPWVSFFRGFFRVLVAVSLLKALGPRSLATELLALFTTAEFINKINGLGLAELVLNAASMLVDFLNGDVLHTEKRKKWLELKLLK